MILNIRTLLFNLFIVLAIMLPFSANAERLFGYIGFKANTLTGLPRWQRVLEKLEYEKQIFSRCDESATFCYSDEMAEWRDFVKRMQGLSRLQQVREVNNFVNRWRYMTDYDVWGLSDYWATPVEFLQNSGDCEDYAILKYVSLRNMGIPAQDLRLVVVRDVVRDIAHAILAVKVKNDVMILDSLFTAVLKQDRLLQYKPYYAVNENVRWTYIPPLNR